MKKRGFAQGKWNGVGGKVMDTDNSVKAAAIRETYEEIGIKIKTLIKTATLKSHFQNKTEWGQQVSIYIVDEWEGEPKESEEMAPKWFEFKQIPFDQMWEDERYWLPRILNGETLSIKLSFDENQKLFKKDIKKVKQC